MKRFKNAHPFTKALIASFMFLLLLQMVLGLTGCGSIKKVEQTKTQTHEVTKVDSAVKTSQQTETKYYGDTLTGNAFVGQDTSKEDTATKHVDVESNGIVFHAAFTPQHNKQGTFTGNNFTYTAIAKPIAKTDVKTEKQSQVTATKTIDTKAKTAIKTTQKAGFSIPWYCWVILVALVLLAAFPIYKPLKNFYLNKP